MRKPRQLIRGSRYHVIARANRNEFILESHQVKQMLLTVIAQARRRYAFTLDTLCIMDNHIHLLLYPENDESLSRILQWILSVFAVRFNRHFGLRGHVWYDRFKSMVIGGLRQFARVYRYIENNPVRAGLSTYPHEYPYGGKQIRLLGPPGVLGPPDKFVDLLFPNSGSRRLTGT